MATRVSVARYEFRGASSSTTQFTLADVVVPSVDGLSYVDAGVEIEYTLTANAGVNGAQAFDLITGGALASGTLTLFGLVSVASVGGNAVAAYAVSVVSGTTARFRVTPATPTSTVYLLEVVVQLYDPT